MWLFSFSLPFNQLITGRTNGEHRLVPVSGLEDLKWEVFVIKDDSIKNAFVIPGSVRQIRPPETMVLKYFSPFFG